MIGIKEREKIQIKGDFLKVKSYGSKFELPKEQQDALKSIVHEKTGLDKTNVVIATTGKVNAVLNDSELWLMLEATLGEGEQHSVQEVSYDHAYISNQNNHQNWITKVFILFKIKGPDTTAEFSQDSLNVLGTSALGSKDMEDFLQEISYKAQKVFGIEDDIEIELKGSQLSSSHMVLFLLIWKKSLMNEFSI